MTNRMNEKTLFELTNIYLKSAETADGSMRRSLNAIADLVVELLNAREQDEEKIARAVALLRNLAKDAEECADHLERTVYRGQSVAH